MDEASNAIYSEKKAEQEEGSATVRTRTTKSGENLSDQMKGKDIMTILRASSLTKYLMTILRQVARL